MSFSSCPLCDEIILSAELERHVNYHFEEQELADDVKLAQQISLASTSPNKIADNQINTYSSFKSTFGDDPKTSTSTYNTKIIDNKELHIQENTSCLVHLQSRGSLYQVEGGLMALLKRCLEKETNNSTCILSGYIDHYQSRESEDSGWGCGWRNIQMMGSHLLMQRQEVRKVLFGGSGFVPDIPALQRWLEIAWERGFDIVGANSFDHEIYGTDKWIGATECATLFRSFGLRARIIDFDSKETDSVCGGTNQRLKKFEINNINKRRKELVYGPMDKFLQNRKKGAVRADPISQSDSISIGGHSSSDPSTSNSSDSDKSRSADYKSTKFIKKQLNGHHVLMDWVWNYFSEKVNRSNNLQRVTVSDRTPLYFQHDGHSRTIVGIEVKQAKHETANEYTLLVLDPGHRTEALEKSLKANFGWQKLVKRGVHTLKKPQYQLCYIDPGVAHGKEFEQLKTIDSVYFSL